MFMRIVVGSDGSPEGHDAIVLGARIAAATGAGLTLLGAYPTSLIPSPGYSDRKTLAAETDRRLAAERDLFAPAALVHAAADGSASRALHDYAVSWHADLVIVGSDSRAPVGRTRISRTGRELLSRAPFAVAVARRGLEDQEGFQLGKVAIGYDGGPESAIALKVAAEIASGAHAELEVMTVVEEGIPALTVGEWLETDWDEQREQQRLAVLKVTQAAVEQLDPAAHAAAIIGDPAANLRDLSDGFDLVVIGSRRWGTLARVVLGGVGETMVSDSGASLVVTRRPAKDLSDSPAQAGGETLLAG